MRLFSKIKAFFQYRGQPAELDVSAAEIKNGHVYLHPVDDTSKVYRIRSNAVDILVSPHEDIHEEDLEILEIKRPKTSPTGKKGPDTLSTQAPDAQKASPHTGSVPTQSSKVFHQSMKKLTFTLYPEEYEMIMSNIKENGYKKTEFLLACVSSAKKNSMQANYQRYTAARKALRIANREAARRSQAEELQVTNRDI